MACCVSGDTHELAVDGGAFVVRFDGPTVPPAGSEPVAATWPATRLRCFRCLDGQDEQFIQGRLRRGLATRPEKSIKVRMMADVSAWALHACSMPVRTEPWTWEDQMASGVTATAIRGRAVGAGQDATHSACAGAGRRRMDGLRHSQVAGDLWMTRFPCALRALHELERSNVFPRRGLSSPRG